MPTNDPRWRPRGRCVDCDTTYPAAEAVLHKCAKSEERRRKLIERQVRTRGGWGPVIAAVVIVAIIAAIIGRLMV